MDDDWKIFAPEKPSPGFPVHVITVTRIAYDEPARKLGIDPTDVAYEIDHGACTWRDEDCIVHGTVTELGLHQAIFGVWDRGEGDNRLKLGTYRVRGWTSISPATPNGPEEYDAGIEEVEDES